MVRKAVVPAAEPLEVFGPPGHACTLTEDDAEHLALIARFTRIGLERAEQCFYLHAEPDDTRIVQALRHEGIDVDAARSANKLVLLSPREANLKGDAFDSYRLLIYWKKLAAHAQAAGFTAIRCAIAMSSLTLGVQGVDHWLEYESQLTALAEDRRCLFLCHYPRGAFAPRQLLDVIRRHPSVVDRHDVVSNLHYFPSRDSADLDLSELALESLLADIESRARIGRAEEQLRRQAACLAEGERLTRMGSWAWDVASREISFWSAEHFRIAGLDPHSKPTYARWCRVVHPDDLLSMHQTFVRAVQRRMGFDHELRLTRAGRVRNVRCVGRPIFDDRGALVEYAGVTIDITEQREAEGALHATQATLARVARLATLGELSTSIAHEVNQPLAAIILNGDAAHRWLARTPANVKETLRAIDGMMRNAHRARDVIARVRALASKADQRRELLDVNELIRDVLEIASGELRQSEILVRSQLAASVSVLGDRVQLQQVVLNLIMNAVEAMNATGQDSRELVVRTLQAPDQSVRIEVQDSGIGVPEDALERIFEPFYTTKAHGTGIGLPISRSIIEAHDGRIWAERHPPAPGLTLHISLPRAIL